MASASEQVGIGQIAKVNQRIIYIEPNDVYDKDAGNAQAGENMTPKYEDFCISFNLIIEAFSRFKTQGVASTSKEAQEANKKTYSIEWGLTHEQMVKRRTSVLQGDRGEYKDNPDGSKTYVTDDYNFLTTYYTDLGYDSVKEKTQIEGLGVESVQISYESWYTPTVVIKFVDVRGSALFGREEAIHVDEKLTVDNVFGAFFTMPYPLFRLQVKGFLGKPVTYQLTCSNFKGEFNSQTGNFEAVATFIGYSWSLLTDIPFSFLVAAPNATYKGREYWERNVNSSEWALWDDDGNTIPPPKLKELFKSIEKADDKFKDVYSAGNSEQNENLQAITSEKGMLSDLESKLSSFLSAIQGDVDRNYFLVKDADTQKEQLLLFYSGKNLTLKADTIEKYQKMYEALQQYTSTYTDSGIGGDKSPNKWISCPKELSFIEKFNVLTDTNGKTTAINVLDMPNVTVQKLQEVIFNDRGDKLTKGMAEHLFGDIKGDAKSGYVKNYAYLIDLSDLRSLLKARKQRLKDTEQNIIEEINANIKYEVTKILGFKPFIGNIFKIIFCHVETFCHIMFDSADEIYKQRTSGQRSPDYLGISMEHTDVNEKVSKDVVPWPAVYDAGKKSEECGYETDYQSVYGWVGDFSHNFIEEKVVYAIQEGIQEIIAKDKQKKSGSQYNGFPMIPSDFIINNQPFGRVGDTSFSDVSGYLAMRAAASIGVMAGNHISTGLAELLGKMDAYNYYAANPSPTQLKGTFGDKKYTDIKGISYCDEKSDVWAYGTVEGTNEKFHIFENVKKIREDYNNKGRKPMFLQSGNRNRFVHWYDKNKAGYVPTELKTYKSYNQEDFQYEKGDEINPYFIPKVHRRGDGTIQSYDWLYTCDTASLPVFEANDEKKKFIDRQMFMIVTDPKLTRQITDKYDSLKGGNNKVYEYEVKDDLTEYVNTFMKVGKERQAQFYQNVSYMLSGNLAKLGIDGKVLLGKENYDFGYDGWNPSRSKDLKEKNGVTMSSSCEPLLNNESVSVNDLVVQQSKMIHISGECNVFGSPFYYLQNTKRQGESDDDFKNRSLRVKALLFLHTFKYNYTGTDLNVFSKNKTTGGLEAVPKAYLLLMGGLLWRKRYYSEHNSDPVTYKENNGDKEIYKSPGVNSTFFVKTNDNLVFFKTMLKDTANSSYNYPVSELFGGLTDIDYNIENQFIALFDEFVRKTFSGISSRYELKNRTAAGKVVEYTAKTLKEDIGEIVEFAKNYGTNVKTFAGEALDENATQGHRKAVSEKFVTWLDTKGIDNWQGKYSSFNVDKNKGKQQGLMMLYDESDTTMQTLLKELYLDCYIVADGCYRRMGQRDSVGEEGGIWVNNSLYDSYTNGFMTAMNGIIEETTTTVGGDNNMNVSPETVKNRDLSIAVYYYLKNLWDRWLVISYTDEFDVRNFFKKNFIFTDSFYKNTYNLLAINCQLLLRAWTELADNASLFNFLSRVVTDHGCIFLPVPDYVGFNGETQKHDIEMMEDLFRPLPYNSMTAPSNNNKFIVMYTHNPSHTPSDDNGYTMDSYDIWSHEINDFSEESGKLFQATTDVDFDRTKDIATRVGYNVPSFGVSFGRQNNHIFKSIKANMDNPVMTEQSIKALWNIAKLGSGGDKKVCFIGQDTFNVFSNYSYSITVDMVGNAQICPLMYFQLMNVPLWKGTYMIYKVVHNMTPGDMTTTITAMKMSKYARPFNSSFFVINKNAGKDDETEGNESSCEGNGSNCYGGGDYGTPGMFTGKTQAEKLKMCGITNTKMTSEQAMAKGLITSVTFNQTGGTATLRMNKYIAEDFKKICDEILALGWFKLRVGNSYRPKNSTENGISRHCWGVAVDINGGHGGNPWFNKHIPTSQPSFKEGDALPWTEKDCKGCRYGGIFKTDSCIWDWNHPVVKIFLKHGWGWGGAYGDTMHFSIDGH